MERTVATLKERIRAGSAKIPAEKVIRGGMLVNVMSSEIYPADIAVYKDMIAAVWNLISVLIQKSSTQQANIW